MFKIVRKNKIDKLLDELKSPVVVVSNGFVRIRIKDGDGEHYSFKDDGSFHGSLIRLGHILKS